MNLRLYDAHNHLQDERFAGRQGELLAEARSVGMVAMVVNGSSEADWDDVTRLAAEEAVIIPSYGLHPWYHHQRSSTWREKLRGIIAQNPRAVVGEFGLDRWRKDLPYDEQESVFLDHWNLARQYKRPATIHCLQAWGNLMDLLRAHPGPEAGFILHSFGGPREMITELARHGAYFSFPGYYLRMDKEKHQEAFRHVPLDRLLVETDAPDQRLPDALNKNPLMDPDGKPINHPANLRAIYAGLAALRGMSIEALADQVEQNMRTLFAIT